MRRRDSQCGPLLSWDDSSRVSREIRRLRSTAGLVQEDIAFAAWLHPSYVSRLERGRQRWRATDAQKAAQVLGTTVDAMLSGGVS